MASVLGKEISVDGQHMLRLPQVFSPTKRLKLNRGQLDAVQLCLAELAKGTAGRSLLNYDPSHKMLPVLTHSLLLKKPKNGLWEDQITVLTSTKSLNEVDTALQKAAVRSWRIRPLDELCRHAPGGLLIRLGSFDAFCAHKARYGERVVLYGTDDVGKSLWHDLMRATKTFRTLGLTTGLDNKLAIDKYADWDIFHNHSALDELQDLEAVLRFTTINVPGATTRSEEKPPRASPALLSPEVCNQIVTAWEKRPPSADRSTVVFCFDLDHCQALQAAFDARGHESFIFDSNTPHPEGILLACHDQWPSLKLVNRITSMVLASPWVVDNNEAAFFERLELTRSQLCHIIQVVDSSFPGLVSLHSLAKMDPNVTIEDQSVDSIIDMTRENSSIPASPWMTRIHVRSAEMTDVLTTDVCDQILKTWEQISRRKTTIVYCKDLNECQALQKVFRAKSYDTVLGDSSRVIEHLRKVAPQIVFVPRDNWSATWKRHNSINCDCLIIVRPITHTMSYHLARIRRANTRDCKIIQVVDPDSSNVMTLAGWDDGSSPPVEEETTESLNFAKSEELEEQELTNDYKRQEKKVEKDYNTEAIIRNKGKWADNEKKVANISVDTPPEPPALGQTVLEQKPKSSPNVVTETLSPVKSKAKRAAHLVQQLTGTNKMRWWECGDKTLVVDILNAGHLVVTMHEKPDSSFGLSCYMHSAPLWAFSADDVLTPLIKPPGLNPEQAKVIIMGRFVEQIGRNRRQNPTVFFADWHRSGCSDQQIRCLEKALRANPRVRFTKNGRYLEPEANADGLEVLPPHETLKWVAREEGSLMLARLRYSPLSEPLLTHTFILRISKRIRKGYSTWGLQKSNREAKRERLRLRKEGKKERKKARNAQKSAKEEAKAQAIARREEAIAKAKMRAQAAAQRAEATGGSTPVRQE